MKKKFLIPVGVATASLFSSHANAISAPVTEKQDQKSASDDLKAVNKLDGVTTHVVDYQKNDEMHRLLMKKSESGVIFADHYSHSSHSSHRSHRSGHSEDPRTETI
ncbi:hypothetical protein PSHI8_24240 [Polynucleobacter sp. SHI8]|uniref:His-Xaa-Ser repeat protein HxsA2 n=1 Tax=unclassified Polynucleobacter TaxID=2640945 RepID=UPI00249270C1|nr:MULTISPECIES: His-Xaa-Ser repeat protein HxsA2 [unclassified Polynucleobacter]BDW12340.1 hypothetical protein PSHI2_24220 [Polynucleobacter sp. SHI2]BDW14788.1 hypothetical protein PSHI8_24240 [Polynucleobacter sp. SHI8]